MAQLVETLRYKPDGRGFDSRWCHWNLGLRVEPASIRNEYQEYFLRGKGGRCLGLTLPPSCANCLEILKLQPPGTLRACPACFIFTHYKGESNESKEDFLSANFTHTQVRYSLVNFQHSQLQSMHVLQHSTNALTPH